MSFGKYTYGRPNIFSYSHDDGKLIVGNFCSIAGTGVNVYLGGNHRTDWVTTYPFGHIHQNIFNNFDGNGHPSTKGDVIIGNDVWIGRSVFIMSGRNVANGSIIAAGTVLTKDFPEFSIIGGNPSKLIKSRK